MPFLSNKDSLDRTQGLIADRNVTESTFGDTFQASLGNFVDEELSISSALNNEGIFVRKQLVKELGTTDQINISEYTDAFGIVDYNRLSKDTENPDIKTDQQLFNERVLELKKRREFSQDVISRGSGWAQFAGMATGAVLDPINLSTMGIATAGVAVRSMSVIARALTVARNEAGIAIAAETMIQPLVFKHKHDIDSPFEFTDALTNIAAAAAGGAVIGGTVGGISGYFKSIREKAVTQPLDDDAIEALSVLERLEDDIVNAKERTVFSDIADDYGKFRRGEFNSLVEAKAATMKKLEVRIKEIESKAALPPKGIAEGVAPDSVALKASEELEMAKRELDILRSTDDEALEAVYFKAVEKDIEADAEYLREINNKMEAVSRPTKRAEDYTLPPRQEVEQKTIHERERAVLTDRGLEVDYDADIDAFQKLDAPKIVQGDDVIDAKEFIDSIDEEIDGINDVLRCVIG